MGNNGKRRFRYENDLNREIEKLLLDYYRETNEIIESINVVPSYENEDMLVQFYVQINYV